MRPNSEAPRPSGDVPALLSRAIPAIRDLGEGYEPIAENLGDLRERLAEGRFHLAVLGQFKRGKSTLLNALLGEPVLPTAVVPLTAIPTFIRPGETRAARVHFRIERPPEDSTADAAAELSDFLAGFVTETGNPKNELGVAHVEVFHPAPILQRGVVLIDTPGIGSTFRHNTEATLNFLPQCDAALFLVSADPPITEVEVAFLRQVRSKVARLFFILNKVDYLSDEDRRAALDFLKRVLAEQAGVPADVPIFCVSARAGLESRRRGDETLWTESGLAQVERHLVEFLAREKASALREAVGRKASDSLGEALLRVRLATRSLQMPLEDLQGRLKVFEAKIEEAHRQRTMARDLLAGDQRRMHDFLEEHAESLRAKASQYLGGIAREAMARNGGTAEEDVQGALAEAIPGYFEHQVGQTTELFRDRMAQTLRPHQDRADQLIESVRKAAAELFDVPYHAPESSGTFEIVRQPYWVTHTWSSKLSPIPVGLVDRLVPASVRDGRVRKRLLAQVADLVVPNVENLRWAVFQSIDQTFARFGSELDRRLADTIEATHGAIRAGAARRESRADTVAKELERLESAAAEIERLRSSLAARTLPDEPVPRADEPELSLSPAR
ncbi:MAG: dynamin family protein [Planctomycetota bacterium]